jgi:small subunit ribosomal protein S7
VSEIKFLGKWDISNIKVEDPGLEKYITLDPVIVPKSFGRHTQQQFHKSNANIVERLANHLFIPGHRGKKHLISSGRNVGKTFKVWKIIEDTFEIIEKATKKNPVEVFLRALENAALREEITSFQVGGIIVRKAVITSPQRRIDIALRLITQGAYQKSFGKEKNMATSLADELLAAYNYDSQKSHAIREKERIEREAMSSR